MDWLHNKNYQTINISESTGMVPKDVTIKAEDKQRYELCTILILG